MTDTQNPRGTNRYASIGEPDIDPASQGERPARNTASTHELREAVRFAEEYGYSKWLEAQEELNGLRSRMSELEQERDASIQVSARVKEVNADLHSKLSKAERDRDDEHAAAAAMSADLTRIAEERDEARAKLEAAEDFRAEIVVDAFTGPEADWHTILDSLRARIADLQGAAHV